MAKTMKIEVKIEINEEFLKKELKELDTHIKLLRQQAEIARNEGDRKFALGHERDAIDLEMIYIQIEDGLFNDAKGCIMDLDTVVRDEIPNQLYNLIVHGDTSVLKSNK